MLKVKQLFLNNIGPFSEQLFDFSIQENSPDIHIFTGINGSGKTTILHSIASEFDYFENDHKEHLSNLFYKRFQFGEDDEKEMAKSYCHLTLVNKSSNKVIDKIVCYKCKNCGNIHQNYDKTYANDLKITKTGKGYQWQSQSKELQNYKNAIVSKDISNKTFKFAAFGYSGYRFINSAKIQIESEQNFNPLHLALEFVKDRNTGFLVLNWIASRYSKAAVEEVHGNKELANKYREALNCLIDSINELTNNEYSFEVQTNPWKVVIKYFNKEIDFDVLPDGLRSLLSWLGDLLMRLDEIPWENKTIPVNHQHIILLLDEIEVHLHPRWQYEILPLTRKIFPNAQIFVSTHSPFVLNSINGAKIYKLITIDGISKLENVFISDTADSYSYIYENILETFNKFGLQTTKDLTRFDQIDLEIMKDNLENESEFREIIDRLKTEGEEITAIISSKLFRLQRIKKKDYLNGEV